MANVIVEEKVCSRIVSSAIKSEMLSSAPWAVYCSSNEKMAAFTTMSASRVHVDTISPSVASNMQYKPTSESESNQVENVSIVNMASENVSNYVVCITKATTMPIKSSVVKVFLPTLASLSLLAASSVAPHVLLKAAATSSTWHGRLHREVPKRTLRDAP